MVLHAGIVCYKKNGAMMTFNSYTRQKQFYNLIAVGSHDINGVDLMFENLKTQLNGDFGCLCICLGYTYDSEIRKKFIHVAKNFGFANVHITDWCSMNYYDLVPRLSDYRITGGDVIWIFCGKYCYVWEKGRYFAEMEDEYEYKDTVGSLKWIRRESETNPDYIIYGDIYDTKWKTVEKIFKNAVVLRYTSLNNVEGVLMGALLMTNYTHLYQYKTEGMLERDIKVKINGRIIFSVDKWQWLPFVDRKFVTKPYGCNTLEIMSHFNKTHHKLPDFDEFILELFIDTNGICSVNYEEVQKQKQHQDPVETTVKTEYITVGIKSSEGEFVCGSDIAEKRTGKIEDIVEKLHDIVKIDSIFDELKEKINLTANQNLKNLYLFLDYSYKSEIRKKLIEAGIKCGFEKVEIVDQESMNLFCGITECKNVENFEECIIWILKGLQCHLWKKTALHANFIGMIHGDYLSESGLKMMKEASKLNADPNFIFFCDNENGENNENVFLQAFPNCEIMTLKETENWKCYTFERDLNQYNLDIDAVQDRKIVAKIGDLEIFAVRPYQKLPFSITKKITNDTDNDELTITEGKDVGIKIPTNDRFCLQIDIDKNGIYSLAVVPDEEEEVDDEEKKDTEIEEKSDLSLSDNDKAVVDELINKTEIEVLEKSNLSLSDTDDELIDIERNKTEIEEKIPLNLSAKDDNPITEGDLSNSDDEIPIPKSKEKLQALRGPMIMTELFTRDESSNTFAHLISSSASNIHQKFQPSQKDALLSPPLLLNELSLMPPPSYEESESFFRQPSPLPFQSSQISLIEEKHDDDDVTISEVRAKLAEQKRKLIDRLKPKILRWAPTEDVKKISDMMAHKDILELLEYLENENLLEARVLDALNFLHGTKNVTPRPRNKMRSRIQVSTSRTPTSPNNSQARPRWR